MSVTKVSYRGNTRTEIRACGSGRAGLQISLGKSAHVNAQAAAWRVLDDAALSQEVERG